MEKPFFKWMKNRGTPILGNLQKRSQNRIAMGQDLTRSHKCVPFAGFPRQGDCSRWRCFFWAALFGLKMSIQTATSAIQNPKYNKMIPELFRSLPIDSIDDTIQYYTLSINTVLYTHMVYKLQVLHMYTYAHGHPLTGLNAQGVHLPESCFQALDRRLAAMELHGR